MPGSGQGGGEQKGTWAHSPHNGSPGDLLVHGRALKVHLVKIDALVAELAELDRVGVLLARGVDEDVARRQVLQKEVGDGRAPEVVEVLALWVRELGALRVDGRMERRGKGERSAREAGASEPMEGQRSGHPPSPIDRLW